MTNTTEKKKERPLFRVSFSRFTGKDDNGHDIVGSPKEIGCIWRRKEGKAGGILQFDHIPIEMTKYQGVIFIVPVDNEEDNGGSQ